MSLLKPPRVLDALAAIKRIKRGMGDVKIAQSSLLLCGAGVALMCFRVCDSCSYMDTSGMVHDNIFCCLGPPFMVFLGVIGLAITLILKIIIWIQQYKSRIIK